MIDAIMNAMIAPFTKPEGWQAFAYGVTGRVIIVYAKNFINQYSDAAETADEDASEDLEDGG